MLKQTLFTLTVFAVVLFVVWFFWTIYGALDAL